MEYLVAFIFMVVIELCFELYKSNKHIDNLYTEIEWLKREIQFQDEWIELDMDLGDDS